MALYTTTAAIPEDAERLADLRVAAMRPSLEAVGRFDLHRARVRFLDGFSPEQTQIILFDGTLAGFAVVREAVDHLYLDHLYVLPEYQGLKIGRAVIHDLQRRAQSVSLPVRLMALQGSPANAFYRRCGFHLRSSDAFDNHYEWRPSVHGGA